MGIRGELETNRLMIKEVGGRSSLSVSTETSEAAEKRTGGRMTVRGGPLLTQISTGAPDRADDLTSGAGEGAILTLT
jgi:hypothetical protein